MLLCSVEQSEDSDCNRNKLSYRKSRHVITCPKSPDLSTCLHSELAGPASLGHGNAQHDPRLRLFISSCPDTTITSPSIVNSRVDSCSQRNSWQYFQANFILHLQGDLVPCALEALTPKEALRYITQSLLLLCGTSAASKRYALFTNY